MRTLPLLVPALLLGACTVGPNYAGPPKTLADATGTTGFKRAGPATINAAPAVADWWTQLNDPTLTALEQQALAGNPTIAVAEARLRQAAPACGCNAPIRHLARTPRPSMRMPASPALT